MAISVVQEDVNITLGAYDPCIFISLESAIGTYKFSYWVEVRMWDEGTGAFGDSLARYTADKNSVDCGVFDLGPMVRPYIDSNWVQQGDNTTGSGDPSDYFFQFTFGSRQASSADSPAQDNVSTATENRFFVNGSLRGWSNGYNGNVFTKYGVDTAVPTVAQQRQALTVYGGDAYDSEVSIPVRDDTYGWLDFSYSRPSTQLFSPVWMVEVFGPGPTLSYNGSVFTATPHNGRRLYCYPLQIADLIGTALPVLWTSYRVRLRSAAVTGEATKWHYFRRVDNQCQADTVIHFGWYNELGGWDFISFTGRIRKTVTVDRQDWRRVRGNWWTASGSPTAWTYEDDAPDRMSAPVTIDEEFECHTGILQEVQNEAVESLMRSRQVYATWFAGSGANFYPVVIKTNSWRELTRHNDKIIEYTFNFAYSSQTAVVTI